MARTDRDRTQFTSERRSSPRLRRTGPASAGRTPQVSSTGRIFPPPGTSQLERTSGGAPLFPVSRIPVQSCGGTGSMSPRPSAAGRTRASSPAFTVRALPLRTAPSTAGFCWRSIVEPAESRGKPRRIKGCRVRSGTSRPPTRMRRRSPMASMSWPSSVRRGSTRSTCRGSCSGRRISGYSTPAPTTFPSTSGGTPAHRSSTKTW